MNLLKKIIKDEMNEEEKKYFWKEEKGMEVEEDNNNSSSDSDSETTEGESDGESEEDEESEGGSKDSKRGNDVNVDADDNLVAEEKDNPLEVPNDELEAQFNACVMKHRMDKIKKREERHG